MPSYKQVVYSLILLTITVISGWFVFYASDKPTNITHKHVNQPLAVVENVAVTHFDKGGKLNNQVSSKKMTYDSKNKRYQFIEPHITVYRKNQKPWKITAKYGHTSNDFESVELNENVILHQVAGPNNQDVIITTNEITYYPKKHFAKTNRNITLHRIDKNNTTVIVRAKGAQADLTSGTIKLLSHVRINYATKH